MINRISRVRAWELGDLVYYSREDCACAKNNKLNPVHVHHAQFAL